MYGSYSFNKHHLRPDFVVGLFLVALSTRLYNPCLLRGSKFIRRIDERISGMSVASVQKQRTREAKGWQCPLRRRDFQIHRLSERRNWFPCRRFKKFLYG
jgi:hypothetical protein